MRGELRAPRVQVLADGMVVPGLMAAEVHSNNHLAADRFRCSVAFGAGGAEGLAAVDAPGVRVEVQVGTNGGWTSLVVGEVDSVSLDPLRGVVDFEGRDLAALLIDTRVDETFANRTSSEIAGVLAGRHGLEVSATSTDTLVGRYYRSEHDRSVMGQFSRAMSEWDLLAYLAGREGFDLFMDGAVLRFEARGEGEAFAVGVSDCLSLRMEHALGMERAIEVTVRSWDQRGAQAVVQMAKGGGRGRAWKHSLVRPNLPPDEAQRMAERVLADLVRHARTLHLEMPGETTLTARGRVALSGTGTDWDREYAVSEVSRYVDIRRGFVQRVALQGVV